VYSVEYTAYIIQHTACSVEYTACSGQHTVYSIQYAAFNIPPRYFNIYFNIPNCVREFQVVIPFQDYPHKMLYALPTKLPGPR